MAFASPPPSALQARLRARVHAATLTPRWQASPALRQALQEAREALRKGVLPDVPLLLVSDEETENAYCELLETSSERSSMPPPTVPSSTDVSPVHGISPKIRRARRRRLFVAHSDSEEDDDGHDDAVLTQSYVHENSDADTDEDETDAGSDIEWLHGEEHDGRKSSESRVESSDENWEPQECTSSHSNDGNSSSTPSCTDVLNSTKNPAQRKTSSPAPLKSCEKTSACRDAVGAVDLDVADAVRVGSVSVKSVENHVKFSDSVIDLCISDDDDISSLVAGVQKVSLGGKKPIWLTKLTRTELAITRDVVAKRLMKYLDDAVLSSRLSSNVSVSWNKRLLTTAGYTTLVQKGDGARTASIDLSVKVLDEAERLYITLAHEMCHAAAWIVDEVRRPAHGKVFKKWALTFKDWDKELNITRCHSFDIRCKYNYKCESCAHVWGRHSKSIDTTKVRCSCKGVIVLQPVGKEFLL